MKKSFILLVFLISLILGIQSFSALTEKEYEKLIEEIDNEYEKGNKEKAILMIKGKIEQYPTEARLYMELGMHYDNADKSAEAEKEFAKMIEISKTNPIRNENGETVNPKRLIGSYYYLLEKNEKALKWLKEYERENPKDTDIHFLLALVYIELDNLGEAKKSYMKVENSDTTGLAALRLGYIYDEMEGNQKEAIKWYTKGIEKEHLIAYKNLGILYAELSDYRKAESWTKKGIQLAKKQNDKEELKQLEEVLKAIQEEMK